MPQPWKQFWKINERRLCVGLMLAAYLLTVSGFPIPAFTEQRDSQPFACQGHACGCSSTEQCKSNCCCVTRKQNLARAKEHASDLPTNTIVTKPAEGDRSPSAGFRWVLGISARHCHGFSTLWISSGAVAPPPPALTWSPNRPAIGSLAFSKDVACHLAIPPDDPPPRFVSYH